MSQSPHDDSESRDDREGTARPSARPEDEHPGVMRTLRELPRPVTVLVVGLAVNRMGSFVSIFLVLYLTSLGFSPTLAGVALTCYGVGSIVGVFTGGVCADRFGSRRTIIGSMLMSSVAVGAVAAVTAYGPLLVVSVLAGFVTQVYRPAASAVLAELTPVSRLVMTTAVNRLGINLGAAIGPLLGVWLATYSYRLVFVVGGLVPLVVGLASLVWLPPGSEVAAGTGPPEPAAAPGAPPAVSGARALLRDRRYLLVVAAMFATALAEVQYQSALPLSIDARGLGNSLYGTLVALNAGMVIAMELPLTKFVQRLPMRVSVAGGTFLICCGLALFGVDTGVWLFYAATAVWTMGEIVSSPSVNSYPALIAPPALRGRYISALTAAQTTGYAVGPAIGTMLFQQGHELVWLMCAFLAVAGGLGMWLGIRLPGRTPDLPERMADGTGDVSWLQPSEIEAAE